MWRKCKWDPIMQKLTLPSHRVNALLRGPMLQATLSSCSRPPAGRVKKQSCQVKSQRRSPQSQQEAACTV